MTGKPTYEALEAQVSALTKEVSNLEQSQRDFHVLNDSLNTLHEATMDLLEKRDLSDLLAEILTRVTGIFQTDTGFLYLLDEDEDKLVLKVGQGHFAKRIGYRLDRGAGLAGKVLQTGKSIVVDDYSAWEGRVPDPFWDTLQSIAGFPIRIQNKTIGVIGIHQIRTEKAISQHELDLIKRFADLASLGLKNAHLYELLQKELIDRKRVEEALRESETQKRAILDASIDTIRLVDKDMRVIWANKTNTAELKKVPEQLVGNTCYKALVGRDTPCPGCPTKKALKSGNIEHAVIPQTDLKGFKGKSFWEDYAVPIKNESGDIVNLIQVSRNITDYKEAEEALKERESNLRQIIDLVPQFIFIKDEKGKFIIVNKAVADAYGTTVENLTGKSDMDFASNKEEAASFIEKDLEVIRSGEQKFIPEEQITDSGGNIRFLQTTKIPFKTTMTEKSAILGMSVDITFRKKTEEEIRKLSTAVEQSPSVVAITDLKGNLEYVNPQFTELTGYSREEAISKNPRILKSGHQPVEMYKELWKTILSGKVWRGEFHNRKKNGELFWEAASVSPIFDKQGEITNYIKVSEDITGRKLTEEALRQSEEKYRNLFDTAMVGMYRTTIEDGKVIEANAAFAKIFGYETVEELKKEFATAKSYVNPERREALIELLKMRGSVDRFEIEEFRKDGTCVFVEVSGTLHTDQGYIEGFIVDNTDRKRAEEALRESEEKYRTILESIEDGYYEVDIDGNFTFFNDSLCEIYGYPKNEMMGLNIRKLTDQETAKRGYSLFNKVYTTGRSEKGFEWPITRKDGTLRVVEASVSLRRNAEGVPRGFRGIIRDISEKQKLEAQLQRAQKMEAIGTLAGGVAHDLNNILGGLVSYPELLLFQLPEDSPLRKSILTIQKSGEKAAAVVQDLLTLARRGVVVTEVIRMNAVIAEYLKSPEHENLQSYHPDVHIETHLETDVLNILGSSTHLSKAVMNLVSNAAEAMLEGGTLTISTENRYIDRPIRGYDAIKEGDFVVLTISDTGTGISPDDIGKIFEPFYTKKKMGKSGTGLGMAVVWGTVKDHNGYIHVQSAEGKGTTFTLYFPVTRNKLAEDNSKSAIESYSGNGEPILIVDDVEEQRNIAFGMLEELGYSVMSVSSGEEAVEYLKTNKTDLLLLDMIMDPGMDGLDTYKKILEIHPGQKAIIGSGFSETARVKELQSLGAGGYIRKPFLLEKLGLAVKEELEK